VTRIVQVAGSAALKRVFDFTFASLCIALLSPVILVTATAVRLSLGKPILFRQLRTGYAARPFTLYKLRTMRDMVSSSGTPLPDEQRLTRFGRVLRSTSLDELPTLLNVLKGEMSFVGPRPLLLEYVPRYSPHQMRRHEVLPGITGWAQVNGRNSLSWERKFELDVWYVDNHSVWLDVRILWMTLFSVIRREGISQHGHATAERFNGSHG
jgi:sugar transferase EpsL